MIDARTGHIWKSNGHIQAPDTMRFFMKKSNLWETQRQEIRNFKTERSAKRKELIIDMSERCVPLRKVVIPEISACIKDFRSNMWERQKCFLILLVTRNMKLLVLIKRYDTANARKVRTWSIGQRNN